ncbi:MAG: hypothetical protein HC853_02585 [Anaerolineae bacterium]|nr:hypothetical protein [Anaerolineae bacterium]
MVIEERAIAAALDGRDDWQEAALPAIQFHVGLRARHHLLRWRVLFALGCHRRGDKRWRKHIAFTLHELARDDYGALLLNREPVLAERFWALCVCEGIALEQAMPALARLGHSTALLAHLDIALGKAPRRSRCD